MNAVLTGVALLLLLTVAAGLVRVALGPTPADRMVATQLFGTTGVAILMILAEVTGVGALRDLALVMILLATVLSVAFVKRGWVRRDGGSAVPDAGGGDG